jgi:hypothetical protein
MDQEMKLPMIESEESRHKTGIPRETIATERIWNKRPDGLAIKMPTSETVGEFVILEFNLEDVRCESCDRTICHTVKECIGSPICVHKVGSRTNDWTPRLHNRGKISG